MQRLVAGRLPPVPFDSDADAKIVAACNQPISRRPPPPFDSGAAALIVAACKHPISRSPQEAGLRAVWAVKNTMCFDRSRDAWKHYHSSRQRYYEWKRCLEQSGMDLDALPGSVGQHADEDVHVTGVFRPDAMRYANGFVSNCAANGGGQANLPSGNGGGGGCGAENIRNVRPCTMVQGGQANLPSGNCGGGGCGAENIRNVRPCTMVQEFPQAFPVVSPVATPVATPVAPPPAYQRTMLLVPVRKSFQMRYQGGYDAGFEAAAQKHRAENDALTPAIFYITAYGGEAVWCSLVIKCEPEVDPITSPTEWQEDFVEANLYVMFIGTLPSSNIYFEVKANGTPLLTHTSLSLDNGKQLKGDVQMNAFLSAESYVEVEVHSGPETPLSWPCHLVPSFRHPSTNQGA